MARFFDGGSGFLSGAFPNQGVPLTIAGWVQPGLIGLQTVLRLSGLGSYTLKLNASGFVVAQVRNEAGDVSEAVSSAAASLNTWTHVAAVFASDVDRRAFLNGANKGTNTSARTVTSVSTLHLGSWDGASEFLNGPAAEFGIWAAALDDDEILDLASGLSPLLVRGAALVSYLPIFGRHSPELDLIQGSGFALTGGAPQSAHPPIIYPAQSRQLFLLAEDSGGGVGEEPPNLTAEDNPALSLLTWLQYMAAAVPVGPTGQAGDQVLLWEQAEVLFGGTDGFVAPPESIALQDQGFLHAQLTFNDTVALADDFDLMWVIIGADNIGLGEAWQLDGSWVFADTIPLLEGVGTDLTLLQDSIVLRDSWEIFMDEDCSGEVEWQKAPCE